MHPRHQPAVVPLLINRRFHRTAVGSEKGPESPRETVAVDVGEVFPVVLPFHGNRGGGFEVAVHPFAGFRSVARGAECVCETGVGYGGEPVGD